MWYDLFQLITEKLASKERGVRIAGLRGIQKVYQAQKSQVMPEKADLISGLTMLQDYYQGFVEYDREHPKEQDDWFGGPGGSTSSRKRRYDRHYEDINKALKTQDPGQMLIAMDNGIDSFHHDLTVLDHLSTGSVSDKELAELAASVSSLMRELGRKASSYSKY